MPNEQRSVREIVDRQMFEDSKALIALIPGDWTMDRVLKALIGAEAILKKTLQKEGLW